MICAKQVTVIKLVILMYGQYLWVAYVVVSWFNRIMSSDVNIISSRWCHGTLPVVKRWPS